MGIFEIMFIILLIGKIIGFVTMSWWVVFAPLGVAVLINIILVITMGKITKKEMDKWK